MSADTSPRGRVERITKEISGVRAQYNITSWEGNFLVSIKDRRSLSESQERVLASIEKKVFGEDNDA